MAIILDAISLIVDPVPTKLRIAEARSIKYVLIVEAGGSASKFTTLRSLIEASYNLLLTVFLIAPSGVLSGIETGARGKHSTFSQDQPLPRACWNKQLTFPRYLSEM